MTVTHYKDLIAWQKAMDLVCLIYETTKTFPKEELYGLTNQIRRAAVSVPSNIAEGHSRKSSAEYKNFLSIARGSLAEIETQFILRTGPNCLFFIMEPRKTRKARKRMQTNIFALFASFAVP